jgi:hypothetical protein
MEKLVVSFEKHGNTVKATSKKPRDFIPGIIEAAEMRRCDQIDAEIFLHQLEERRAIRNRKYL